MSRRRPPKVAAATAPARPAEVAADEEDRAAARGELARLVTAVPPGYGDWSYGESVRFKTSIKSAKKTIAKRASTAHELWAAVNLLRTFY